MANGNAALSDALGTTPALLGGLGKKRTTQERAQFAGENYGQALEGQTAAELEARTKKGEAKVAGLEAEAGAERELGRTMQRQGEELEAGLKSYEKFEAPEYTASDYAADAAKRLLVGLLIGGTTRLSGEGQLRAIKAMQDAEDQGLEEQFVQARMAFDENEKARVEHNKRLQDRFARLKELATQDRASAMVEAKLLAAQMENGAIAADLRAGNYLKAIKQFEDAMKLQQQYQLEQMKAAAAAESKRALGPDRRLKPGERWNEEKQVIEAIPGSDLFKKQKATFTEDYKAANSTIDQTEEGLRKLESIIDPKRADAFGYNFGGYPEYVGQFLPGGASDMRKDIESFKSVMKNTGLSLIRMGGSIGQITEREWPIIEKLIASIDPVISEEKARETFEEIKARFQRLIERTRDGYETEYGDSQFYKPLKAAGVGVDGGNDLDTLRQQANDAIRNGADANAVRQRFRDMTGKEL